MTSTPHELGFELDTGDLLAPAPRATLADGAVFGPADATAHTPGSPPLVTVTWLEQPGRADLPAIVEEELSRALDEPGRVLIDLEPVRLAGREAVRTLLIQRGEQGAPTASEQWRLLAGGRRWTISATTALTDQPALGNRLAAVCASLRIRSGDPG